MTLLSPFSWHMGGTQCMAVSMVTMVSFSNHSSVWGHGTFWKLEKTCQPSPPRQAYTPEFCMSLSDAGSQSPAWVPPGAPWTPGSVFLLLSAQLCSLHWPFRNLCRKCQHLTSQDNRNLHVGTEKDSVVVFKLLFHEQSPRPFSPNKSLCGTPCVTVIKAVLLS